MITFQKGINTSGARHHCQRERTLVTVIKEILFGILEIGQSFLRKGCVVQTMLYLQILVTRVSLSQSAS